MNTKNKIKPGIVKEQEKSGYLPEGINQVKKKFFFSVTTNEKVQD